MNREHGRAPFDATLIPSEEEVKRYDPRRDGHCCTPERFRPDLRSTPGSAWNQSVIKVFGQSFVDQDEFACDDISIVKKAFSTHLRYLHRRYLHDTSGEAEKLRARKRANRDERKRGLFQRRLTAALSYEALKPHVDIIRRLGVDGMSSDESSVENDIVHYYILKKRWRHPELTMWLRVFDAVYRKIRVSETNRATRGAPVHWRHVTNRYDNERAAVPCLPKNAYNPDWLNGLHEMDREDLAARDEVYAFVHPPEIAQCVMPYHILALWLICC
ncbi:hypothetical protein GY45DRAFT_1262849 [Cubamyces sp. BRFM 1775]|nr:hypothetical protein GY45DRAFT_1262849 [Cubamyces sp. BRFM 1775]